MKGLTMKRQSRKTHRMVVASVLTGLFFVQQTMTLQVLAASTITGVTNGGSGTFNVDPTGHKNGIGYRGYTDFSVGNGDIVNLNFKHDGTNLDTFVNMVTNQVNINGIVNSVRDGAFHNGRAVFVSPNGMVVGASGVLNVGSFGAYTSAIPAENFNTIVTNQAALDNYFNQSFTDPNSQNYGKTYLEATADGTMVVGTAPITVNGKIITTGDANISTQGKITVGETGGIAAGVKENQRILLESTTGADALFDSLVNSNNLKTSAGDAFVSGAGGSINIVSVGGGMDIDGTVVNYGENGSVLVKNTLAEGTASGNNMVLSGSILNKSGNMTVQNDTGNLTINNGSQIYNDGTTVLSNITDTRISGNSTNNGFAINGNVETVGNLTINNAGELGLVVGDSAAIKTTNGKLFVVNGHGDGQHGTDVSPLGSTNNTGAMNLGGNISTVNGDAVFYNTDKGVDGMKLSDTINIDGQAEYYNYGTAGLIETQDASISSNGLRMENYGTGGLTLNGGTQNTGKADVLNYNGAMNISGTFNNNGDASFDNLSNSNTLNVNNGAKITNETGTLSMHNRNGSFNIKETANITNNGTTSLIDNEGAGGLNIDGRVHSNGALTAKNTGAAGLNINTPAILTGNNDITLENKSDNHTVNTFEDIHHDQITINGGLNIQGKVDADRNVKIRSKDSNVVIGDNTNVSNAANRFYVQAGNDIDIDVDNGSVLNFGVDKVLLQADRDLLITTKNGSIGLPVKQAKCSGTNCTGLGVKSNGSREFTKSINGMIGGKVKETTSATTENANNDYVINYAAIDSDMKIDAIKANGRVILTVDDSTHAGIKDLDGTTRKDMLNQGTDTNIEGWGMSLISNGSIGTKDNKVTFIQNKAATNSMDALANENIYLKENSFDAYGRDNETTQNEVCSMVAREGDLDVEFAGNTNIQNITAEGDMKVVTRGKELNIKNLGHVDDPALINNGHYEDYFGTADGWAADGRYAEDDFKHDILPNNATVKALDINHNIRTTDATIKQPEIDDGDFEAYAGSKVKLKMR